MIRRKKYSFLYCIIILGLFLSGCSREVEQTNEELTVYIGTQGSGMLEMAVDIFEEKYPDVIVNIIDAKNLVGEESDNEAERMANELMSGEGADVFLIQKTWDIEKMIDKNTFADLSSFFDTDTYFQGDGWEQKIFEGGCKGEYRYAIPTEYGIPILISSQEAIDECKIDVNSLSDFNEFISETDKYMEMVREDNNARRLFRMNLVPRQCLSWGGYPVVNWDTQSVDLENEQIQSFFEWCINVNKQSVDDYYFDSFVGAASIRDGEALFDNLLGSLPFETIVKECRAINSYDKAVMVPIRNIDGGINAFIQSSLAVRANSENLLNAYRFIQIYMSTEVQTSVTARTEGGFKVNKEAQMVNYETIKAMYFGQEVEGFPADCPEFSEEEYEELMGYIEEVANVGYTPKWQSMLYNLMIPYMNGESNYEESIRQATNELEIYVSE